jgi:hypothetical protein
MRTVRLGRTFDLVTSFGNALSYALLDEDLRDNRDFRPSDLAGAPAPAVGGVRGRKLYAFARRPA